MLRRKPAARPGGLGNRQPEDIAQRSFRRAAAFLRIDQHDKRATRRERISAEIGQPQGISHQRQSSLARQRDRWQQCRTLGISHQPGQRAIKRGRGIDIHGGQSA